jgi:maltose alpha-D-glucosyltransferase/alpha-amylase
MRSFIDAEYPNRFLLAEANQPPVEVSDYFGNGDEFHSCFHFPIMPRLFISIRKQSTLPIARVLNATPQIPENCQWATFLRNHDELTLEMCDDEERRQLYEEYAKDPRMRCNIGIRRRLAPLVENDRREIELLHALLFGLPGSPFLYYGDEIGMGDNIYLGDRDGVRTPMQWSGDRNGGFSKVDFARLYFPVNMDPVFGYQSVNVEAQMRHKSSLLQWIRTLINFRKSTPIFGRGSFDMVEVTNHKVLTFLRKYQGHTVLCIYNLSDVAQPVEIPLPSYLGYTPLELFGKTEFPPITSRPYQLSISGHTFFWFSLIAPIRVGL